MGGLPGQEELNSIEESESNAILCDSYGCIYKRNDYQVALVKHPAALARDCNGADIFINLTGLNYNCYQSDKNINIFDLKKNGTYEIFLGRKIRLKTSFGRKLRAWE
jgi:hypothetical protein